MSALACFGSAFISPLMVCFVSLIIFICQIFFRRSFNQNILLWGIPGLQVLCFSVIYTIYVFLQSSRSPMEYELFVNLNIYYALAGGFGLSIVVSEEDTLQKLEKTAASATELSTLKTSQFVLFCFCFVFVLFVWFIHHIPSINRIHSLAVS